VRILNTSPKELDRTNTTKDKIFAKHVGGYQRVSRLLEQTVVSQVSAIVSEMSHDNTVMRDALEELFTYTHVRNIAQQGGKIGLAWRLIESEKSRKDGVPVGYDHARASKISARRRNYVN